MPAIGGTQSGPMLLIDGKLHPEITDDGPSRTRRNGVGVDRQGRAHFVISEGPVSFGKEDAGRNLPHGVFVDNIGLNGLMLLEGQNEREFFITASPIASHRFIGSILVSNLWLNFPISSIRSHE